MITRLLRCAAVACAASLLCATPVIAQDVAPDALVRQSIDETLGLIRANRDLQGSNPARLFELVEAKVLPHFDFARMTRLAVGRSWSQASDAQKAALTREFQTLLVRTYSTSLSQYRNQTVDVKPAKVAPKDDDVTVKVVVSQPGGQPIPIDFGMGRSGSAWKVYDVLVDGVSLVTTYRSSFNDQIQKSGIEGLIKTLADRNRASEASRGAARAEPKK